jgi:uncharacterized protein (TIGR00297 family)
MRQHLYNSAIWHATYWTAALVTMGFAALARILRGVTLTGTLAGGTVCFVLYAGVGSGAFISLAAVFVLTWIATRIGYRRKQALGKAERRDGRSASQVLANLGVATAFALLHVANPGKVIYLLGTAAALAEAAADTVASEVGQVNRQTARLITTWKQVPAGTDGGITLGGTLAGIGAATFVSVISQMTGWLPPQWTAFSILGASAGMVIDSYLGAWLERRALLSNDLVNLLGTLSAALIGMLIAWTGRI